MVASQFYDGSLILTSLGELLGFSVDQINFIVTSILAIGIGQLQRKLVLPNNQNTTLRMAIEIVVGVLMCYFCFGKQIQFLLLQSTVAYAILKLIPSSYSSILILLWSMGFLITSHAYRQYYDYGGYTLDITGPLMIQTQKLTSLGFNLQDGERLNKGKKLSDILQRYAILKLPSVLEFYAYTLYYHGIMAGPFVFFSEYRSYINCYNLDTLPSAKKQMGITLVLAAVHGILTAYIAPYFPYTLVVSSEFEKVPMTGKLLYTTFSFLLVRQRYYFAWSITEAAGMSAGLGFSGNNKEGEPQWDTIKNSNIRNIESGSSIKLIIDGWNCKTAAWLRVIVYERTPIAIRVFASFLCSAAWHGLYPGYYLMFLSFALFTIASRIVRRNIRPHFQQSPISAKAYDIFTIVAANLVMNYCQGPFILLGLEAGLIYWKTFYFFPHFVAIFIIFCSLLRENDKLNLNISVKRD